MRSFVTRPESTETDSVETPHRVGLRMRYRRARQCWSASRRKWFPANAAWRSFPRPSDGSGRASRSSSRPGRAWGAVSSKRGIAAGARTGAPWAAEVVVKAAAPTLPETERLRDGQALIAFLSPLTSVEEIERLAALGVHGFALESIPRITRAQPMDALSSQATVA